MSVPEEIYDLVKQFKEDHGISTMGKALYWLLDNSQYHQPTDNPGYVGGQWYEMEGRMMGIIEGGLKPLEENPVRWHKERGAADEAGYKQNQINELQSMIDRIRES